jgi:uncharacterized membrane protein YphA (DoxX/SURF4 family)
MDASLATTTTPIPTADSGLDRVNVWTPLTRVGFRFVVSYFSLYIATTQMLDALVPIPIPSLRQSRIVQDLTILVATNLFGFTTPLVQISGSGDKPFDWALAFVSVVTAVVVTTVWSTLDRRRLNYVTMQSWFRLFLRFAVGSTLLGYGMAKVFPNQMPYPQLARLVEPYGNFSLMGVLWQQMGASPAYERFTGVVESVAGLLLLIPGLTLLGSLLALAAVTQVFIVNMTYDIPVKLFSFHLVLMCLVLLAPDRQRLANLFILNRPTPPSSEAPLLRGRTPPRIAILLQLAFAMWLVWSNAAESRDAYSIRGPHAPKPPLYGIWEVEMMSIDGVTRAPLMTDYDRWRRVIVQTATSLTFQRMDDTFVTFLAHVDLAAGTITLSQGGPNPAIPTLLAPAKQEPAGQLTLRNLSSERVTIEGQLTGRSVRMDLRRYDHTAFRLLRNRFHWVQDYPVNR